MKDLWVSPQTSKEALIRASAPYPTPGELNSTTGKKDPGRILAQRFSNLHHRGTEAQRKQQGMKNN
jgi:hypothetical protein